MMVNYNNMVRNMKERKCHNCKGLGLVTGKERKSICYYCNGKGSRSNYYGKDE